MKRLTLILGLAAAAAFAAPHSARAQGCSWWDLTCNGLSSRVTDYGWHIAGRDANGNVVYLRRLVDSNGNVVFQQARRSNYGLYQMFNTHTIRNGLVYNASGERCKYNENEHGYKEECKYAKGSNFSGVRYPSSSFGTAGSDCKYQSNEKGYKEECKYPKTNTVKYVAPKYHAPKYKAVKYETPKYHAPKYVAPKYKAPKAVHYEVKAPKAHYEKPHEEKMKGPKH